MRRDIFRMHRRAHLFRVLLATAFPLAVATAQPAVTFTISAPKTVFYLGEIIPLQLAFTSTAPETHQADTRLQDRVGRLNYEEVFKVDPADSVEDPLRGLPGEDNGMGGISGGPVTLSAKPFLVERILNEWVRFARPGTYRVTVESHRVRSLDLTSNTLTIELRPAPADWVKEQIARAVTILDGPPSAGNDGFLKRQLAGRTLRFLDTPESAIAALPHLDENSFDLHMAVLGSPFRRQLLPLMEQRLVAPDQPVESRYLQTLSNLAELVASGGVMPAIPKQPDQIPDWQREYRRRATVQQEKRGQYIARLVAALPGKQAEPRAVSAVTVLNTVPAGGPDPPWERGVVEWLVRDFRTLPLRIQSLLLDSRWNLLKGPAMLPVLRDLYTHPPDRANGPDIVPAVVRRLSDLAPDEGRPILLAEIHDRESRLPFDLLASLPDRTLPDMDDALAARLESGLFEDALIVRYATGAIVQRVERAYERRAADFERQNLPHCATPLAYYFLRYDPEYGERELRRSLAAKGSFPACYDIGFAFPGAWAMSPALERVAIEMLSSPSVPVKNGAATVLGKYGSTAAKEPLWQTLEYFRSWWKDREADLKGDAGREGIHFEQTLLIALAQGYAWTLREPELTRLQSLCSSDWRRQDVAGWLQAAKSPALIEVDSSGEGMRFKLAQYEIRTDAELRRRLAQFPPKTEFRLQSFAGDTAREHVREIVIAAGHIVE